MTEPTSIDSAAYHLGTASMYLHQYRATCDAGTANESYRRCAILAMESAADALGFRLIPITEQKDAA